MSIIAWPFLVSRNKVVDYRTIIAPQFMIERQITSFLAEAAGGETTEPGYVMYREIHSTQVGTIHLLFRVRRAKRSHLGFEEKELLFDQYGRPLFLTEGFVLEEWQPEDMIVVTGDDFLHAHEQMQQYYREFWDSTLYHPFSVKQSIPILFKGKRETENRLNIKRVDPLDKRIGLKLNLLRHEVWIDGTLRTNFLTNKEFQFLRFLAAHAGQVCSREETTKAVYGNLYQPEHDDARLDALVERVRKSIGDAERPPRFIETVRGTGHRLHEYLDEFPQKKVIHVPPIELSPSSVGTQEAQKTFHSSEGHEELALHTMCKWLELRRRHNRQAVLIIGSQCGALYRSSPFYSYCQQYMAHNVQFQSPLQSFRECYQILTQLQLGERELHTLLQDSLRHTSTLLEGGGGDGYFADIVKKGYFREIISTNIDDLIEQSLHDTGLIEQKDFEVVIARKPFPPRQRELPYRLTKVFGDWLSREYVIHERDACISNNNELNQYLREILSGDVLAVGLDPKWDSTILPLLRDIPTSLWFVNGDEKSINDDQITPIFHQRRTTSVALVGENFTYESFWRRLHQQLNKKDMRVIQDNIGEDVRKYGYHRAKTQPIRVMYIYCDEDLPIMQKFWNHLHVFQENNLIAERHRGTLKPGEHLQLTQERDLNSSQLIFVGFSSSFLKSEYYKQAVQALKLSSGGTATLVPLLLSPIGNWKQTPFSEISPLPQGGRTLSEMTPRELERELSKIAENIHKLIISLQKNEENLH
ncbi:hypothetical protein KSF_046900 [Reticulibacter mediterranei]|uniref:OmpR/PhoB-type domain-containing protein n=1 Tax=Reticulibacter mediterranei TaxID=2778369 RepID=A0A8J3N1V9_9CHLR|nr:winged helix-turn-helix domain-containing protein [Reticulibacter mediterranei]GHO94642.1 hypothetical protein KSF_046900 [Reticulibacter mediterranei]